MLTTICHASAHVHGHAENYLPIVAALAVLLVGRLITRVAR